MFQTKVKWIDAYDACDSYNTNLLQIDDDTEYSVVQDLYSNYGSGDNLWVNLIKIKSHFYHIHFFFAFKIGCRKLTTIQYDFWWILDNSSLPQNSPWYCGGELIN